MRRCDMSLVLMLVLAAPLAVEAAVPAGAAGGIARSAEFQDSSAAQPQEPARDEFVPVSELPPEEQLPAAPFLIGAYAVAWLVIVAYVWRLWRRLGRVEQELREVARARVGR